MLKLIGKKISAVLNKYLYKFGQNPFNRSQVRGNTKSYADTNADADRINTKNSMSPHLHLLFYFININICCGYSKEPSQ